MTLRYTLFGSLFVASALLPLAAQAQTRYYYEADRSPTVVYEPAPPVETRVDRYWDSDRGVWVERRVVEERPTMHWVPERRVDRLDGSIYIERGHWEYDR
jgi:hypothetical protein